MVDINPYNYFKNNEYSTITWTTDFAKDYEKQRKHMRKLLNSELKRINKTIEGWGHNTRQLKILIKEKQRLEKEYERFI